MYENGDSFRHHVDLERYGINPTIGIMAGPDTRIDLSYEYLHDRRTTTAAFRHAADGALTVDEPLDGFDKTFFGDPDKSHAKADVHQAKFGIEHRFAEGLTLRNRTLFGDYDKFYQNVFPNRAANGAGTVALSAYNDATERQNLFTQTDLIWENRLAGIDQTILFGFELGRQKSRQRRQNGFFQPGDSGSLTVPLSDPTIDANLIFYPFNVGRLMSSDDVDRRMHADQFHQRQGQRRGGLRPGPDQAVADVRDRRRPALRPVRTGHHQPQQWRWNLVGPTISGRRASGWSSSRLKICRSTPATRAPTCRNRATSSAASTDDRSPEAGALRQL